MEGRDSFIFYKSFYEAMEGIGDKDKLKLYDAICKFALYGEETKLTGISNTLFILIKPQLQANTKKFTDGKKGGRPKKETTGFEKEKTTGYDKTKTTGFENKKPNVNVNDNVNVNYNENQDDYKDIFNYLCMVAEKFPNSKEQVNFYQQCIKRIIEMGKGEIIRDLDISKLSKCWEKMNQQQVIENKESYFISCLINEVEND